MNNFFLYNLVIIFSSLSPCFSILFERINFLNNRYAFVLVISFLSITSFYLHFCDIGVFGGLIGYSKQVLFLYPLFIALFNIIFTYRYKFNLFSKTFSRSLLLGYVLTETHEIANFFYEYVGGRTVINNNYHFLANSYLIVVLFVLFKKFNLSVKISLVLSSIIVASSFLFYHFIYLPFFSPFIRIIQFMIFVSFFYEWGNY